MTSQYNEDNLVEQATADTLQEIGWDIKTAYKHEIFGSEGTLGRENKSVIILKKFLIPVLKKLNPDLPKNAYDNVYFKIAEKHAHGKIGSINRDKYLYLKNGINVEFLNEEGELVSKKIRIFDFENPENNHFIAVRQLEVQGDLYLRRPDIVGFVNGIPLVVIENKKAAASPVTRRSKTQVDVADSNEMIRESDVAKMSDKEFEERADEINKAMRNGKFIYDVSGNAR